MISQRATRNGVHLVMLVRSCTAAQDLHGTSGMDEMTSRHPWNSFVECVATDGSKSHGPPIPNIRMRLRGDVSRVGPGVSTNQLSRFLGESVYGSKDVPSRYDGQHTSITYPHIFRSVYFQPSVNDSPEIFSHH